jgi:hypothetical protein
MPSLDKNEFLKEVLSHVKFPFDRDGIRAELESHITDRMDDYIDQGIASVTAERMVIDAMGDPAEIGIELNRQHKPWLGWLNIVTGILVGLLSVYMLLLVGPLLLMTFFSSDRIDTIPKSDIVYRINVDKRVTIDDTVIHFTDLIYEKNSEMNIFYEYYNKGFCLWSWSLGTIGDISDNLGNKYFEGGGGSSAGFRSKCIQTVDNFSPKAESLIIRYDHYNRRYRIEIPLRAGEAK